MRISDWSSDVCSSDLLLKALAEEPEQRYATAEALADDLRRWLDGRPVLAQKPKPGYRLRKFVMRNKVGVAAGVLLAGSVAGGMGATLWKARDRESVGSGKSGSGRVGLGGYRKIKKQTQQRSNQ